MKRILLIITIITCSIKGYGQDIVGICDKMVVANDFDKVSAFLNDGGMVIEPMQNIYGYDPNLKIIASNGVQPLIPIMCTVIAKSKTNRNIELISVVYNGNAEVVINRLKDIEYKFLYSGH